jgi:hypothetical protein
MKRFSIYLIAVVAVSVLLPATVFAGDFSARSHMSVRPELAQQQDCPGCARLPLAECIPCNMGYGWTKEQSVNWCGRRAHCRGKKG